MTRILGAGLMVVVLAASAAVAAQEKAPKSTTAQAAAPVNLNTATPAQLVTLPGIGQATAQRIVEYRQKSGGFKKVEEILESSRSPLILLRNVRFDPLPTVSESRKKSQEISR